MNITICVILVVIAVLEVGQAITLNNKLNLMTDKVERLEKDLDIVGSSYNLDSAFKDQIIREKLKNIERDILGTNMEICNVRGKLEEINQRSKEGFEHLGYDLGEIKKKQEEGFQVNLNHLLQLRQSAFDLEVNSNENRDKINAAIRQESAKNIMLHVRGVKNS